MTRLSAFLFAQGTSRNVLAAFALMTLTGVSFAWLTPHYQAAAAGFEPFDMQFPLTREMMVIQFGAFDDGIFTAYLPFAAVDMFFPLFAAAFTALVWAWLIARAGLAGLAGAYCRGWWIWATFPALCDLAENVLFLRILAAYPQLTPELIDIAVPVHRAKLVFLSISQGMTALLILAALAVLLRRRFGRG
jgi:hypothetical protein